ncbi:GSU2403 family nucleotidyltransferase fold protein [Roseateles cellulosilyticus]|uniref:Nucleotidyltransferase domain-containing protein n=1 Tax=Pelomonas cellulosilytica TaxID=2906762 RepID=A0ABS8Y360_9BURK|nr:GSU2403 family nucleotidyltransferase fold protein [Pelomonas sp. P8]MCE4556410.1 nucleotidyltransferase domain-containing protein [Pelomonas sp. P8]
MNLLSVELSLGAQTSYAELYDMARSVTSDRFATLRGSFHRRQIKNRSYVYFNFRDADGHVRSTYVGPAGGRVKELVDEFEHAKTASRIEALAQRAQASMALGCCPLPDKHFRIIHKLANYGVFRWRGVLVGTHAFVAIGNMLGVRWKDSETTMGLEFADADGQILIALPADPEIPTHDTISSLEIGLLPVREFSGLTSAQRRNQEAPALRIEFMTPAGNGHQVIQVPELNIALQPRSFTEFLLEDTCPGVAFSKSGACAVNLPAPERLAVHRLIIHGERQVTVRTKSSKGHAQSMGLAQAAALIEWHTDRNRSAPLREAWQDALARGSNWRKSAEQGRDALLKQHPELAEVFD